jgi:23S rRNA (guanosine2251-2'-O)-methyltransferase
MDKLEGRNAVLEALRSDRRIQKIFVAAGANKGSMKELLILAQERGVPVEMMERRRLERITETRSDQGVVALVEPYKYVEVEDILARSQASGEDPLVVILDGIEDPQNLGSILRTCDAAGVHGVIIPKRRAVGVTPAVAKASSGAIEFVPVAQVTNIVREIQALKERGLWVVAADMEGDRPLYHIDLKGPLAVVIGGEGRGLARLTKEKCDFLVKIPMKGRISSLNAGVATGILLYEVMRQRDSLGNPLT